MVRKTSTTYTLPLLSVAPVQSRSSLLDVVDLMAADDAAPSGAQSR
jgi:hypothetical protein